MDEKEHRQHGSASNEDRSARGSRPPAVRDGEVPSLGSLLKATLIALVIAAAVLVVAVLPAEYGIDPTGIGEALGLAQMAAPEEIQPGAEPVVDTPVVTQAVGPLSNESLTVTLLPDAGAEIKVRMREGEMFVFDWVSEGGPVNFDMHGEPPGAPDDFTSYWAGEQTESGAGLFVAPIDGTHGWFWRNRGDVPVTLTVTASGFFEEMYQAY